MADSQWKLWADENVVYAKFPEGMPAEESEFIRINERFEELAEKERVDAHISIIQMESSLPREVIEKAAEAAKAGKPHGITRWALVSNGIKGMAFASSVKKIDGIDAKSFKDVEEAEEWATN
ncbi:hypothetical protein [Halorubrum pallidum]|uniref:STAS/SEC14 domain-containing protein n=1 Tax=Halorubrum pallidum TaxID=1526114 RepID=A0ABD5T049_9EURY